MTITNYPSADSLEEMSSSGTVLNTYTNSYVSCSSPAIDSEGNIWVPGYYTSQTLTEFAPSGTVLNSFSFASGANPESVVFDRNGNMWVTLSGAQEVEKLTPGGTVLATVPVDTRGSGLGPTGIAVDGANNLWVAGHRSGYVWEISSSGVVQGSWSDGGVANSLAIDPSGNVWVDNALAPSLTEIAGSNVGLPTPAMAKLDALNNNCENLAATALNAPPSLVNGILSYSSINVWNTSTDLDALYPAYPAACEGNN
jgi:sugar lactone lactonase YvrE